MTSRSFDYIVIGAGASGCAVAGRLAESGQFSVALVEAGGGDRHPITKVPATAFLASVSPERNWNFQTEPIPALGNRTMRWNQGRLLGGSSSINGMIYMRGHSREYDTWRDLGCQGWGFDDVLHHFKRAENSARGAGPWHGDMGPFPTRPSRTDLPVCEAFLSAARDSGYPLVDDLNADVEEGFGRFDINVRNGQRVSAATAYIAPVLQRSNFSLISRSQALRLIFEGSAVRGVEVQSREGTQKLLAAREVIVSCGALNSPQLLMLSGIGPADELTQQGIAVRVEAPQVGANLRNHPAYTLRYACREPVTAYAYLKPLAAASLLARYALGRKGPLAESYVAQGGFFRTRAEIDHADSIVVMSPALVTRGKAGERWRDLFPNRHGFAVSVSLGRPSSRGRIGLRSADPLAPPRIYPNFLEDPDDLEKLMTAVQKMRDMMRSPSISRIIEAEMSPGPEVCDRSALERAIRTELGTYSHPSGTCRMGADSQAVLDARLRVRGVSGLRVADTSVMPTPLNACTHGPAIMIGEKAAAMILEDAGVSPEKRPGVLTDE